MLIFLNGRDYHIIFLADRWFPNVDVLSHIETIGCFYCFRSKSTNIFSHYNSRGFLLTEHLGDIRPHIHDSRVFKNIFYTSSNFVTNLVVSRASSTDDPWYIITNDNTSRAIRNYSYRFGSIECIFKSHKSNGFRLESTNTKKIEHFISLFTIACIAILWLTIIGADYSKNKNGYKIYIRDSRKSKSNNKFRTISLFNLGLTIFNICYYNNIDFNLKFNFVLYDI